ncbi:relaxase domain-containing protein [Corynebacterium phoceense]|uniref:MobF family relaxase n=1 Tax=Corynebacterium phoceense TaxID=1686286 RepID=UPI00211CF483|nr:MobF family relaxase [Corynebacterium phoceense]MCQ9334905.1 relaxase domain-containing protein [Corynebacterium phoceense]
MRIVHAGDGYTYLLNSVASHDDETSPEMRLGDYYNANGTPPGHWFGRGLHGLGNTTAVAATEVNEDQMAALYGEGMHPDADELVEQGAELKDVQLGRTYPYYTGGDPVLEAVKTAERQFRKEVGRRPGAEERNHLAFKIAAPYYLQQAGAIDAPERDVLAWLNEKKNRVKQPTSAIDLTFSPSKSISLVWALADEDTRKTIERIHHQAVEDALREVEDEFLFTRTGARGERVVKARGMIASTFMHYDTRAGDPDLHTHCLISNKVQAERGQKGVTDEQADKWRALDARYLLKNSARIGQRYQVKMTHELSRILGLEFYERVSDENKSPVWEVAGIDEELIKASSKRRSLARPVYENYAEQYRDKHGHYPDTRARNALWQAAILETRDAKKPAQSLAAHRASWLSDLRNGQPINIKQVRESGQMSTQRTKFPAADTESYAFAIAQIADNAVEDTRNRRAEFNLRHLETSVSMHLTNWKFDSNKQIESIREAVIKHAQVHLITELGSTDTSNLPSALQREDGQLITAERDNITYAARATLDEENGILSSLNELTAYTVTNREVEESLEAYSEKHGFELNEKQAKMAHSLLVTGEKVACAVGPAGTGKTASMEVVAQAWKKSGHNVFGLAPSARAAQQLGNNAGISADTVASLTYRWRGIVGNAPHDVSKLGVDISAGDMLLVDEAGMVTTADLAALTEIADETGAIIRMVGDPHQLDAVETGGLFRTMVRQSNAVELDTVMRMGADVEQAENSTRLRRGDVKALALYRERGWVHGGARQDVIGQAVDAYLRDVNAGFDSIVVASKNEDVVAANTLIQSGLIERGIVKEDSRAAALVGGEHARIGDTVLARRNEILESGRRVLNGERFEVVGISEDGSLKVRDPNAKKKTDFTLPADYAQQHVQLGYASTVYRAQGITVNNAHAVVGAETDRRALYVAMTRGKWQNHVYVAEDSAIDFDSEMAHWHMSGVENSDYNRILERIVMHDSGQKSATDRHHDLIKQATGDEEKRSIYRTAADLLHTDYRREVIEPAVQRHLGQLPESLTTGLDMKQATERISTALQRLHQYGVNGLRELDIAVHGLEGAHDVGAVIAHRLGQLVPESAPELVALPPHHEAEDRELYDWATAARIDLSEVKPRQLRPVDPPLPESGEVRGADLRFADLRSADLNGLTFIDCDLNGAVFDKAEMHHVMFDNCDLRNSSWREVEIGVGDSAFSVTQFVGCDLRGADFTQATAHNVRVVHTDASNTVFASTDMESWHISGSVLTETSFEGTQLDSVSVVDSQLDATVPDELIEAARRVDEERDERAEAFRRAQYAGGVNLWPEESTALDVDDAQDSAPEL